MNIGTASGKIFLLYKQAEEKNVRKMRRQLLAQGIIAVPCDDPANFRFVTPEVVQAGTEQLDVIGRLALKHLGTGYSGATEKFVTDLRMALYPQMPKAVPSHHAGGNAAQWATSKMYNEIPVRLVACGCGADIDQYCQFRNGIGAEPSGASASKEKAK